MEIIAKMINYFSKSYTSVVLPLVHWSADFEGVASLNVEGPVVKTKLGE